MLRLSLLLAVALLASCGDGDPETQPAPHPAEPVRTDPLPTPAGAGGGVTGMPEAPGPGDVPLSGEPPPPDPWLRADTRFGLPPLEDNPEAGLLEDAAVDTPSAGPDAGPADVAAAAEAVRSYYAALSAQDFARAYALWSDGGRSSGQTPEAFAAGFAGIAQINVHVGDPGPVEGAAGSRYVEIPVEMTTVRADGGVVRHAGTYTLRRAVVDGASAEQRAWRIASAQLREVAP